MDRQADIPFDFARGPAGPGNAKSEARNPKQIRNTNDRNTKRKTKPIWAGGAPLAIGDCGLGIRGGEGGRWQTKPIRRGACAKRTQFRLFWARNEGRDGEQSQFGGSRLPRLFAPRNDTGRQGPGHVKRTQFRPFWAKNEGRAGKRTQSVSTDAEHWGLESADWGFEAVGAWEVKRTQFPGGTDSPRRRGDRRERRKPFAETGLRLTLGVLGVSVVDRPPGERAGCRIRGGRL